MPIHFQTCFYARYKSPTPEQEIFWGLQKRLRSWLCQKEGINAPKDCPALQKNFQYKMNHKFPSGARCITYPYIEHKDDGTRELSAWAFRYIHQDSQYTNTRTWVTDVAIRRVNAQVCLVHVKVEHSRPKHVLVSEGEKDPQPAIPRFVRTLIDKGQHYIFLANSEGPAKVPVQKKCFTVSTAAEVNILYDQLVESVLRKYVIIVAYGYKARAEAMLLHEKLRTKALVAYLDNNNDVKDALDELPYEYRVPFNHIRVFYPVKEQFRNITIPCDNLPSCRDEIVGNLLSNYPLIHRRAVKGIEDVKHLISISKAKGETPSELIDTIEELKREKQEAEDYGVLLEDEVKRLEEKNGSLQKSNDVFVKKLNKAEEDMSKIGGIGDILGKVAYPSNLKEMLTFFAQVFEQRIEIHEDAYKSAEKYTKFKDLDKAWMMLMALCTTLYDMKYIERRFDDREFTNRTKVELSMTEGPQTMKDSGLMKLRHRVFKGKPYAVVPHLKWSTDPNKLLRIHFAFMEDEKKILIGHCGEHLPIATTRKVK